MVLRRVLEVPRLLVTSIYVGTRGHSSDARSEIRGGKKFSVMPRFNVEPWKLLSGSRNSNEFAKFKEFDRKLKIPSKFKELDSVQKLRNPIISFKILRPKIQSHFYGKRRKYIFFLYVERKNINLYFR